VIPGGLGQVTCPHGQLTHQVLRASYFGLEMITARVDVQSLLNTRTSYREVSKRSTFQRWIATDRACE